MMMTSPAKRRQLDAAPTTLYKPFRSPLKARSDLQNGATNLQKPQGEAVNIAGKQDIKPTTTSRPTPKHRPVKKLKTEVESELGLTQELRQLQQDLEVLEQATTILQSLQHEKMPAAINRWPREAADDVFEVKSAQVRDNGGLQTMQANAIPKESFFEAENELAEEQLSIEQKADLAEAKEQAEHEAEKYNLLPRAQAMDEMSEEVRIHPWHTLNYLLTDSQPIFTMPVILQQLSINPDLLRWNSQAECWLED
ncbi:hypothetical protein LTR66_017153 [Elasticomyces elasticus]|nr:hypothetical protein LTR66_017153 [Elasticomyces elasticus]